MKLTEAKLKALILETMEEARTSRPDYSRKIDEVGRIITHVLKNIGERLGASAQIQRGQTSNEQTNMVEFTIMKDAAEGIGFIKGRLLTPASQVGAGRTSLPTSEVLEIVVSNMSEGEFDQTTFKLDDIIADGGAALIQKINEYDQMLGSKDSGAAMSESYYDSKYRVSDEGDHDKILGMIQSGSWAQAFSFLEMGLAQEWPEDAKNDLIWDIYDDLEGFHQKNIRPLEILVDRYDNQGAPHMTISGNVPTQKEVEGEGGLRDRVAQLEKEEQKLKLLVADLLNLPEDWWEDRGKYDMDWEGNFKRAGII